VVQHSIGQCRQLPSLRSSRLSNQKATDFSCDAVSRRVACPRNRESKERCLNLSFLVHPALSALTSADQQVAAVGLVKLSATLARRKQKALSACYSQSEDLSHYVEFSADEAVQVIAARASSERSDGSKIISASVLGVVVSPLWHTQSHAQKHLRLHESA
jgi:hypothetical protein